MTKKRSKKKLAAATQLLLLMTLHCLLAPSARGEESTIMPADITSLTSHDEAIDKDYLSQVYLEPGVSVFDLGQSFNIKTVFILFDNYIDYQEFIGFNSLHINDDAVAPTDQIADLTAVTASGFFELPAPYKAGRYIGIKKYAEFDTVSSIDYAYINEIRVYQTPNILSFGGSSILPVTSPALEPNSAENLLINLQTRVANELAYPFDSAGTLLASTFSCFKTTTDLTGSQYILGIDLGQSYFVHAILVVESMIDYFSNVENYFSDFDIFIGEDGADFTANTQCPGSPFLPAATTIDWPFGLEVFCNLPGRYLYIVRQNVDNSIYREMTLCQLGVFGTVYSRNTAPPTQLIVQKGASKSFDVEKITSANIANILDINLRRPAAEVNPVVSFSESALATSVTVDTSTTPATGSYSLTLQSFDLNSNGVAAATLDTAVIQVIVTTFARDPALAIDKIVITRGDTTSFDVKKVVSSEAIGVIDVNLRELPGAELGYIAFFEAADITTVEITTSDAALVPASGIFMLQLESFDASGLLFPDPLETLYSDSITLYITDYVRDADLVSVITMRQDVPFTYSVPDCYAELTELPGLGYTVSVRLREKAGSELPWATPPQFTYVAGQTDVLLDATLEAPGTYSLVLESYDFSDPSVDPLLQPALRTDTIQIEVTNCIRSSDLEPYVNPGEPYVLLSKGEVITYEVPHCVSQVTVTPTLDINLEQDATLGSTLSFVSFDESQPDRSIINIDSSAQSADIYTLNIRSFSAVDPDSTVAMEHYLRSDVIQIQITEYVRSAPIPEAVTVRKDELFTLIIPNCFSSIAISQVQSIDMRQQPGAELPFVSLTEYAAATHVLIDAAGLEPQSSHQLILESFDTLDLDQPTLKIDYIDILIEAKACDVLQEDVNAFCAAHTDQYKLMAQLGVTWEQAPYSGLFETAFYDVFGLDDPDRESCGELATSLVSPYPFLIDFPSLQTIQFKPESSDSEGIYTEAFQRFTLNGFSCEIPITATVWDCQILSVAFKKSSESVEYEIGSGPLEQTLPDVVQRPDCKLSFNEFLITSRVTSNDATLAAVAFDNGVIKINTSDFTLATHTLRLFVSIDTAIVATQPFIFDVTFTTPPLSFDTSGLNVSPLTCSDKDSNWALELPPVNNASVQKVTIEMTTVTEVFTYQDQSKAVTLSNTLKDQIIAGKYCPEGDIQLDFLLTSDVLGTATHTFSVSNQGKLADTSVSSFAGVVIGDEKKGDNRENKVIVIPDLKVTEIKISQTGNLKIVFNRKILAPKITIDGTGQGDQSQNQNQAQNGEKTDVIGDDKERLLRHLKVGEENIMDVVGVEVVDDDPSDEIDKKVAKITLDSVSDSQLSMTVTFNDPKAISKDLAEPDKLKVSILKPSLFIDAETRLSLHKSSYSSSVDLKQQLSLAEFESLQQMAATAEKIGLFASVLEVTMCFFLGKALESMWTLIYATQFLVYIGIWQINYPQKLSFFNMELKRISLGEFVDDLGLKEKMLEYLDMEDVLAEGGDDELEVMQVGFDRFGSPDLFSSLGPTFFISIGLFLLIIVLSLIAIFFGRRTNLGEKGLKRLQNLEDRLFFNPIIRVTLLSALKTNLTASLVFKLLKDSQKQTIAAGLIFGFYNLVPLWYAHVLRKNSQQLENEYKVRKFGSLYDNKNVAKDRDHRVWLFPIAFFYRRTAFVAVSIFLFERPDMQMIVHQLLSVLTIVYITYDDKKFKDRQTRFVEIATEVLLWLTCALIQQLILPLDEEQLEDLEWMIFAVVGVLIIVNISFVLYNVRQNCKEKKRLKQREARKAKWEAAWRDVEQRRPKRFVKQRTYVRNQRSQENQEGQSMRPDKPCVDQVVEPQKPRRKQRIGLPLHAIEEEASGSFRSQKAEDQLQISSRISLDSTRNQSTDKIFISESPQPVRTFKAAYGHELRSNPNVDIEMTATGHTRKPNKVYSGQSSSKAPMQAFKTTQLLENPMHSIDIFGEKEADDPRGTRQQAKHKRILNLKMATSNLSELKTANAVVSQEPSSDQKPHDEPVTVAPVQSRRFDQTQGFVGQGATHGSKTTTTTAQRPNQSHLRKLPTANAESMLGLSKHGAPSSYSQYAKTREEIDELMQEVESLSSHVVKTKIQEVSAGFEDDPRAIEDHLHRPSKHQQQQHQSTVHRQNNYLEQHDETLEIDDFIIEVDTYLQKTKNGSEAHGKSQEYSLE